MGEVNKVVARFLDGSTLKGTTEDFSALRPSFHLHGVGETTSREIQCAKLKAVFYAAGNVKAFAQPLSSWSLNRSMMIWNKMMKNITSRKIQSMLMRK